MALLRFLIFIGAVIMVFGFIWQWLIVFPLTFIQKIFSEKTYLTRTAKGIGYYFFISVIAISTLMAIRDTDSILVGIAYALSAIIFMYLSMGYSIYQDMKTASRENDVVAYKEHQFNSVLLILTFVVYLIELYFPFIADNSLSEGTFRLINALFQIKIIGLFLWVVSFIVLIMAIFHLIVLSASFLFYGLGKLLYRKEIPLNKSANE